MRYNKHILLIAAFCITGSYSFAQKPFIKMFDLVGKWEAIFNVLEIDSGKWLTTGAFSDPTASDSAYWQHAFTMTLDTNLNATIVRVINIRSGSVSYFNPLNFFTTRLAAVLVADSACKCTRYHLTHIDETGDTFSTRQINSPNTFFNPVCEPVYVNGRVYFFGTNGNVNGDPFAILCSDTLGNKLWYKVYSGKSYQAHKAVVTDDNTILVSGSRVYVYGIGKDSVFAWYTKMDTAGNFVWDKTLNHSTQYPESDCRIAVLSNDVYITQGNSANMPYAVNDTSYASLIKINPLDGGVLWRNQFYTSPYKMQLYAKDIISKNGNIYATYVYETLEGWSGYTQYVMFVKLSATGDLIWKRLFKNWYAYNRVYSLSAIKDGFIICGDAYDTTHTPMNSDAWIIKTDTNGCIEPGCHLHDNLVQLIAPKVQVTVFPNPADRELNLVLQAKSQNKVQRVCLHNVLGSEVEIWPVAEMNSTALQLPLKAHTQGIYYLVIEFDDGTQVTQKVEIK